MTIISKHHCQYFMGNRKGAEYQDKEYGKDMRVFNSTIKNNEYRCTVCGEISTITQIKQ